MIAFIIGLMVGGTFGALTMAFFAGAKMNNKE